MSALLRPVLACVAALLLAGCGGQRIGDDGRGSIDFELVDILSETAVGGLVTPGAVALADTAALSQWNAQFSDQRMPDKIADFASNLAVPDGEAAVAAVVAIGCDEPSGVTVVSADSGVLIEAIKSSAKPVECFAPMTMVAIVLVDAEAAAPTG